MRRPLVFRRRLPTMLLAGLLAGPLTCVSVQAASPDGDLRHRVVTGDTLQTLGERYLRAPARWRELQALNKLSDPQALVPGTIVRIPRRLLRPVGVATAKVEFVEGQPVGMTSGTAGGGAPASDEAGIPLAAGDAISEGTRIQVPKDGYLRLRLADGSVVRVLAESDVQLKRLRSKRTTGPYESVIDVRRGKVESDVAPQPKGRRFEIHAPGAVASVRGTRFDVTVAVDGRVSTSVAEGIVKVQPRQPKRRGTRSADVQAGQGAVVATDGQLDKRPTLPDAPDLSTLPTTFEDAALFILHLPAPRPNVAGYAVRIARDTSMQAVARNGLFPSERVQFPALDDGDYLLGVRAVDADGLAGAESRLPIRIHARPVPPLYQAPAPGARIIGDTGQLICSDVVGIAGVHLQVAPRSDFARPVIDEVRQGPCRFGIAALSPGDYGWRTASVVRDADGVLRRGPFAAPQSFSVVDAPSVAGIEVDDNSESPTLRWQAEPGQTFRAQLARDADFTAPLLDVELDAPSWTLRGMPRGSYQVRLQARDASGLVGPFSPARRVHIGPVVRTLDGGTLGASDGLPVGRP
jgi:hypothetical protein